VLSVHLVTVHCGPRVGSCSHIRWLLPLRYPANANHFTVTHGTEYRRADVIVVERSWTDDMRLALDLVRRARADGATLIYTTDDNILDLKIEGEVAKWLSPAHRDVVRYLASQADGVIVSTPPLAEQMSAFNKLVLELPNAVDERLFSAAGADAGEPAPPGRPLVIGYMGTATHDDDLLAVAPALAEVLRENAGAVELQLVGGVAQPQTLAAFQGLPARVLQTGHDFEYPAFVRWMARELKWDVGIAPLRDDVFTRAKSDIKALDYAGLGVPAVYSDVGPYARSLVHGETGLLAANEPAAWLEHLRALVRDGPLRRKLAAGAREWMMSSRVLRRRAGDWRDAIETIRRSRRPTRVVTVPGKQLTARVVVPGSVNYFYDRAGERVAEALRGIGVAAEVTTLARAAGEAATSDRCFLVNPYEIAAGHGDQAGAIELMRGVASRGGRCVAVALECVQTPWFSHSVRLCRDAGLDTILDLGFHSQLDELPDDVAAMYRFCFNGPTASERRAVPVAPAASDRPIPWVLVGHQSADRAELAYRLTREGPPDGFVYLPRLSPVTEAGPHLNGRQFQRVLSHAKVQLWCSHHPHFYMESERFRDSLLTGSVPLKVVDRPPDASRVFPFEHLVAAHDGAPAWVRAIDYGAAWARFRDEFLGLPSLEEGLAAFVGVAPPADADAVMGTAPDPLLRAQGAMGVLLAV
jgi:glycosyltransferase involved in cell wall biosynthesis